MPYDAKARTIAQLFADWAAIMREFRHRDVIRTNNNPVGDIAEAIVAAYFGGERGAFSQAGWDVKTADERIQVKAIRQTPRYTRTTLSPIRDSEYDSVVVVIFDEDFNVTEGLKFSRATVEETFPHKPYVNGRIVSVTKAFRSRPDVASLDLSAVAATLHG
jgi:hypothetical protein